jgi:hypothetical protein
VFVLVFKVLVVLRSLEWSLSSKNRPVCSVDEPVCDYVRLSLAVHRRLMSINGWGTVPYDVWSNLLHVHYLAEVVDRLARRRPRRLRGPSPAAPGLVPRILSFTDFKLIQPVQLPNRNGVKTVGQDNWWTRRSKKRWCTLRFRAVLHPGVSLIALHVNPHPLVN